MTGEDMTKTMLPVTTKNIKHRHIKHKKYAIQGFHSIRTKLILIMILMMGLTLLVFSFLNYTLLSPFYAYSKASQLEHSYQIHADNQRYNSSHPRNLSHEKHKS